MKRFCVVLFAVLALSLAVFAQAPPSLPGYQVSLAAGYSLLSGAQNNNGFFSSVAVPLRTWDKEWSFNLAGRGDYFSIVTPSTYVITAGPEFRFQFSRASFFNGKVFQPFANVGAGAARSSAGSGATYSAWKLGAGLDMPQNSTLSWRLFEVDYIHSKIFPNNYTVLSNWAEVETGLKLSF